MQSIELRNFAHALRARFSLMVAASLFVAGCAGPQEGPNINAAPVHVTRNLPN
jgi:hypothetical protein